MSINLRTAVQQLCNCSAQLPVFVNGKGKTFVYLNTTEPVERDVGPSHHFDPDVESVEDEKKSDLFKGKKNPE